MNPIEIIKIAANVGGYLVMCFYLVHAGKTFADSALSAAKELAEKFLERLISAILANTATHAKLAEKIDALSKGHRP
jgi:hypothetical protein